jgi:hypothetical protein
MSDGVGHGQYGQAKGEGHAQQADADMRKSCGQDGAAATAEN